MKMGDPCRRVKSIASQGGGGRLPGVHWRRRMSSNGGPALPDCCEVNPCQSLWWVASFFCGVLKSYWQRLFVRLLQNPTQGQIRRGARRFPWDRLGPVLGSLTEDSSYRYLDAS